jgi:hypothetical protein
LSAYAHCFRELDLEVFSILNSGPIVQASLDTDMLIKVALVIMVVAVVIMVVAIVIMVVPIVIMVVEMMVLTLAEY